MIDRETLKVRVYAESTDELGEIACRLCSKRAQCDGSFLKGCFVPCG